MKESPVKASVVANVIVNIIEADGGEHTEVRDIKGKLICHQFVEKVEPRKPIDRIRQITIKPKARKKSAK